MRGMSTSNAPPAAEMTVKDVVDQIGRQTICAALGVAKSVVSQAVSDGVFPARWFVAMRALGRAHGVEVHEGLFRWREVDLPPERANA